MSTARLAVILGLLALACSGLERGHVLTDDAAPDTARETDAGADGAADAGDDAHHDAASDLDKAEPTDGTNGSEADAVLPCDDGDPCTVDQGTDPATCRHWPAPDGSACGGDRQCLDGSCLTPCLQGPCPAGLELYDGCRCRVPPSGMAADRCLTDQGLTPCETIPSGSPYQGQDGHVDGRSLHFFFANPWTKAADHPPDNITDLRTGLRWALPGPPGTLAQAEEACAVTTAVPSRLPTLAEALTLLDLGAGRCPWLDSRVAASCPMWPFRLWTSTHLPWDDQRRFVLTAMGPSSEPVDEAGVLCLQEPAAGTPNGDTLVDLAGGSILDRATGLQWERTPACQACTWSDALAACRGRPGDWHLATAREAWTLLRTDRLPPLVEPRFSGDLATDPYAESRVWTGTPWLLLDDAAPRALALDVRTATSVAVGVDERLPARCVRRAPVGTDWQTPEARANAITVGEQWSTPGRPALAALPDEGFVAVWLHRSATGAPATVMARRFDARGLPRDGSEVALSADQPGDALEPVVTVSADGAALAAWTRQVSGSPSTVEVRRLSPQGLPDPTTTALPAALGAARRSPALAAFVTGGTALAFAEGCDPTLPPLTCQVPAATGWDVRLVRLDPHGSPLAEPLRLTGTTEGDQTEPSIAALPDGRVFAGWMGGDPVRPTARVVDPLSAEGSADTRVGFANTEHGHPTVFAQASVLTLAYEARRPADTAITAYASQFSLAGQQILTYVSLAYEPLNQGAGTWTDQRFPQGAVGPDNDYVVVYDLDGGGDYKPSPNDRDSWAVAAQPFTYWAFHDGPPHRENAFTRGAQTGSSVVVLPDGQQVVLWTSDNGGGAGRDVWFRRSEQNCRDDLDNDGDHAADAEDPDCFGRIWMKK